MCKHTGHMTLLTHRHGHSTEIQKHKKTIWNSVKIWKTYIPCLIFIHWMHTEIFPLNSTEDTIARDLPVSPPSPRDFPFFSPSSFPPSLGCNAPVSLVYASKLGASRMLRLPGGVWDGPSEGAISWDEISSTSLASGRLPSWERVGVADLTS